MTARISIPRRRTASLALLCATVLIASACSTASDQTSDATTAPPSATAPDATEPSAATTVATTQPGEDTDTPASNLDCDAFERDAGVVRGALPLMVNIKDQDTLDAFGLDLDEIDAAIERLRPIQDMESALGDPREALDAIAADVQAFRDGQFGNLQSSTSSIVPITDVIAEQVCTS